MRTFRIFAALVMAVFCFSLSSCSKDDDEATTNNEGGSSFITGTTAKVDLKKAGSLSTLISDDVKFDITDLTITGDVNGDDIVLIREMAGADINGDETKGKLSVLNLKDANIVVGGSPYYIRSITEAYYLRKDIISRHIFTDCKLTSVILPNSATEIESDIFRDADKFIIENTTLTSIIIGDKTIIIGHYAFNDCINLTKVILGNKVAQIGSGAFTYCTNLAKITIPASVAQMDNGAFSGCNIKEFIVSENNNNYSSLDGVLFNKDKSKLLIYPIAKPSSSYIIPNSVTTIEGYAFNGCTLTSITIGDNVTNITNAGLNNYLAEYIVSERNSNYSSLDGVLFDKNKTVLIAYPESKSNSSYTIPNSVNTINSIFSHCKNLTTIDINNVTQFPANAFTGSPIKSIKVSNTNSNYSTLDGVLFNKAKTSLIAYPMGLMKDYAPNGKGSNYTIPDGVETISAYAFYPFIEFDIDGYTPNKAYSLETLTIAASVQNIGLVGIYGALNIHCKGETPPSIENTTQMPFGGRNVYVPFDAVNTYKQAATWKDNNIIGE